MSHKDLILIIGRFDRLTGLTKYSLLCRGDGWVGTGCRRMHRITAFPLQHPISITPASGRRDVCLHVYPAACGLCRDRHALGMWTLTQIFLSPSVAYTQAICSCRSGLAALSLSGTVLGRRVSLHVWSRTQITLALRGCMVLISVNTVLRLLKRSMCIRGGTHLVVCRYQPVRHQLVRSNDDCYASSTTAVPIWNDWPSTVTSAQLLDVLKRHLKLTFTYLLSPETCPWCFNGRVKFAISYNNNN